MDKTIYCNTFNYCGYKSYSGTNQICLYESYCDFQLPRDSRIKNEPTDELKHDIRENDTGE